MGTLISNTCSDCKFIKPSEDSESSSAHNIGELKAVQKRTRCATCRLFTNALSETVNVRADIIVKLGPSGLRHQQAVESALQAIQLSYQPFHIYKRFWEQGGDPHVLEGPTRIYVEGRFLRNSKPLLLEGERSASNYVTFDFINTGSTVKTKANQNQAPVGIGERRYPSMRADLNVVKSWMHLCKSQHNHSNPQRPENVSWFNGPHFRLIDATTTQLIAPGAFVPYLALSYVWGGVEVVHQDVLAASNNHIELRQDKLPRTIKEAIQLTLTMGYKYLWVDSICINQSNVEEKNFVIRHMDLLYSCSEVTIVAAAGANANAGLPGLVSPRESLPLVTQLTKDIFATRTRPTVNSVIKQSVWNTRGWTYQEQNLSQRCLYVTHSEIFFTCPTHQWREDYVLEQERPMLLAGLPPPVLHYSTDGTTSGSKTDEFTVEVEPDLLVHNFVDWNNCDFIHYRRAVQEYTARTLKFDSDITAAFAGILARFSKDEEELINTLPHCVAANLIEDALQWDTSLKGSAKRRQEKTAGETYPSWSWISLQGSIIFTQETTEWRAEGVGSASRRSERERCAKFAFKCVGKNIEGVMLECSYLHGVTPDVQGDFPKFEVACPILYLYTLCLLPKTSASGEEVIRVMISSDSVYYAGAVWSPAGTSGLTEYYGIFLATIPVMRDGVQFLKRVGVDTLRLHNTSPYESVIKQVWLI